MRVAASAKLLAEKALPIETTGGVIKSVVGEVTGMEVSATASAPTVSQMAYELSVLSDLQVGESLSVEENMTLAWDATSLRDDHINEVHVMFKDEPPRGLSVQIRKLPGGTTDDYFQHLTTAVRDIVKSYSLYKGEDGADMEKSVFKRIKNTISDRVSVNHCVVRKMREDLDMELLELKCNLHPLDGISNKCRSILLAIEKDRQIKTSLFGKDCGAANIAYNLTKMRYRQGKGDPKGLTTFLQEEKIPLKYFTRYVGNRLHVLFHLAGVIYTYKEKLLQYLDKGCNNRTGLRTGLISALSHPSLQLHLKALGLIGKLLTGPWMRVVYGNSNKKSNLEMVGRFQAVVAALRSLENGNVLSVLNAKEDVFGESLDMNDVILVSLQTPNQGDEFTDVLKQLLNGVVSVIERQMADYLSGDLSAPTKQMLEQAKSAPLHNIMSERILGMTDHQSHRAANATMGFIEGKVKASTNKTLQWLNSKEAAEQEKLISFVVKRAREVRDIQKKREAEMEKVFLQRQREKQQKREDTFRRKTEKKMQSLIDTSGEIDGNFLKDCCIPESDENLEKMNMINQIVRDQKWLLDKEIQQYWFENQEDVVYYGHIIDLKTAKKKTSASVVVTYWKEGESEEANGLDSKVTVAQVLVDYILSDLVFL